MGMNRKINKNSKNVVIFLNFIFLKYTAKGMGYIYNNMGRVKYKGDYGTQTPTN